MILSEEELHRLIRDAILLHDQELRLDERLKRIEQKLSMVKEP